MKVAEEVKQAGYKSLLQLCELSGKTPRGLRYWHKHNRPLFDAVLIGCKPKIGKKKKSKIV